MSKLEVDTIDTTSGGSGTLTIGSDQNAALKVKREATTTVTGDGSTTTSASAGDILLVDVSSATATIQLPSSPNVGDVVTVIDISKSSGSYNITVDRNGNKIDNTASNDTLNINGSTRKYVYSGSSYGWALSNTRGSPEYIVATGGTVTTSGNYKIHTFTSSGCFVVTQASNQGHTAQYLVVAGGAGGGGTEGGGGGGAGGYRTNYPSPDNGGLSLSATTYPITVGAGGSGGTGSPTTTPGSSGGTSVFSTITSAGGGGGGAGAGQRQAPGRSGGSGGGGGARRAGTDSQDGQSVDDLVTGGSGNTPPVSPSQGNDGGNSGPWPNADTGRDSGGGGGGAGAVGVTASAPSPTTGAAGNGGAGLANSISGSSVTYAGGGGGGGCASSTVGTGGSSIGGNGGPSAATAGTAGTTNTGSGGGGGTGPGPASGGAGGSGIVIIRYKYQ